MPVRRTRSTSKKSKEHKKVNLKLSIKDFGPVDNGEITLKPLTLFIGPNNSGKSYVAMLIHSLFESFFPSTFDTRKRFMLRSQFFTPNINLDMINRKFPEFRKQIKDFDEGELNIPVNIISYIYNLLFIEIFKNRLSKEIIRSYASPLKDLIRIGKKTFELSVYNSNYQIDIVFKNGKISITKPQILDFKIKIVIKEEPGPFIEVKEDKKEYSIFFRELKNLRDYRRNLYFIFDVIFDICYSKIIENVNMSCYYLPAARSGILQGHKALAASIIKQSPLIGIEKLEIPSFSGVVSDFMSSIIKLDEEKTPFYKLAEKFEQELIKGEIIEKIDETIYPEIKYRFREHDIPLHRASSTVSELAPLFLYLKYSIEPGSLLIIEEPEAHLHPANQRILAKFIVKLIREGVYITITTHSEYLLEQLSNFVMLSNVEKEKRRTKYQYGEEYYLNHDEIGAYVFKYDRRSKGYKIKEVEITKEEGISQEEFVKIQESLYDETIKLRKDIQ